MLTEKKSMQVSFLHKLVHQDLHTTHNSPSVSQLKIPEDIFSSFTSLKLAFNNLSSLGYGIYCGIRIQSRECPNLWIIFNLQPRFIAKALQTHEVSLIKPTEQGNLVSELS